jgi:hypothetical protein
VNHYQRLKVSNDAPAEVIRAAYRALAAKLHPDRLGGSTGPDDAAHTDMAALNAAYEILIDPVLRSHYDASLTPSRPQPRFDNAVDDEPDTGPNTRVDMDWLTPRVMPETRWWQLPRRVMVVGGVASVVVVGVVGFLAAHLAAQNQIDQALSDQYAALPDAGRPGAADVAADAAAPQPPQTEALARAPARTAADHKPTVDELARMSDEELLKALPALDSEGPLGGRPVDSARAQQLARAAEQVRQHLLDGKPLNLRTETRLVDPLAPEPAPQR